MLYSVALTILLLSTLICSSSAISSGFQSVALDTHNEYRGRHGANPLKWDWELAEHAQGWADRCQFRHSTVSF